MSRRKTGPTTAVEEIVEERADYRCEVCGGPGQQIHHRLPRRMGGTRRPEVNLPSNLILVCIESHTWIENNRTEAQDLGLLLSDRENPRRAEVFLGGEWTYLDNKGGFDDPPTCPAGCAVWTSNDPCDCGSVEPHQKEAS